MARKKNTENRGKSGKSDSDSSGRPTGLRSYITYILEHASKQNVHPYYVMPLEFVELYNSAVPAPAVPVSIREGLRRLELENLLMDDRKQRPAAPEEHWAVYADFLQDINEPLGEVIAIYLEERRINRRRLELMPQVFQQTTSGRPHMACARDALLFSTCATDI